MNRLVHRLAKVTVRSHCAGRGHTVLAAARGHGLLATVATGAVVATNEWPLDRVRGHGLGGHRRLVPGTQFGQRPRRGDRGHRRHPTIQTDGFPTAIAHRRRLLLAATE
ncbi:hypothetical protein GCM10023321_50740 [Pseudonocardia eucalypti]|uniref:Uncharacterized protein n=1 Tax=Pseudonocardia eucalypti TaxID=648755 RepID=A0ABP9QL03_9PSEU